MKKIKIIIQRILRFLRRIMPKGKTYKTLVADFRDLMSRKLSPEQLAEVRSIVDSKESQLVGSYEASTVPDEGLIDESPVVEVKFSNSALSVQKVSGKWCVIEVPYDVASNLAGSPKIVTTVQDRSEALEHFRILAGTKYMSG